MSRAIHGVDGLSRRVITTLLLTEPFKRRSFSGWRFSLYLRGWTGAYAVASHRPVTRCPETRATCRETILAWRCLPLPGELYPVSCGLNTAAVLLSCKVPQNITMLSTAHSLKPEKQKNPGGHRRATKHAMNQPGSFRENAVDTSDYWFKACLVATSNVLRTERIARSVSACKTRHFVQSDGFRTVRKKRKNSCTPQAIKHHSDRRQTSSAF